MTVARHDPLGYDIRAELFGSGDSISVGLGPRTPMRSVEPGVPPPAGPAWRDFIDRFKPGLRGRARRIHPGRTAARSLARASPAMVSRPCGSQRPRHVRSTSTDRCGSRRSPAESRPVRSVKGGAASCIGATARDSRERPVHGRSSIRATTSHQEEIERHEQA